MMAKDERIVGMRMVPKVPQDRLQSATAKVRETARKGLDELAAKKWNSLDDFRAWRRANAAANREALKGAYDRVVDWASRNVVEPIAQGKGLLPEGAGAKVLELAKKQLVGGAAAVASLAAEGEGKKFLEGHKLGVPLIESPGTPKLTPNESTTPAEQTQTQPAAIFQKTEVFPGEGQSAIRYEGPSDSFVESQLIPTEKVNEILDRTTGATFSDLHRPTKSGGDFFGGVDVRNMTPEQYLKFKVDYMNRAADMIRKNRELAAGYGGGPRSGPSVELSNEPARKELLKQYKQELNDIMDKMKFGELTLRQGKAAMNALKGYYSEALGLSPRRATEAELAREAMAQEGATERARIQAQRSGTPSNRFQIKEVMNQLGEPQLIRFDKLTGSYEVLPMGIGSDRQKLLDLIESDPENADKYRAQLKALEDVTNG
jgi:hypothetical protein